MVFLMVKDTESPGVYFGVIDTISAAYGYYLYEVLPQAQTDLIAFVKRLEKAIYLEVVPTAPMLQSYLERMRGPYHYHMVFYRESESALWQIWESENPGKYYPVMYLSIEDGLDFLESQGYTEISPVTDIRKDDLIFRITSHWARGLSTDYYSFTIFKILSFYDASTAKPLDIDYYDTTTATNGVYEIRVKELLNSTGIQDSVTDLTHLASFDFNKKYRRLFRKVD